MTPKRTYSACAELLEARFWGRVDVGPTRTSQRNSACQNLARPSKERSWVLARTFCYQSQGHSYAFSASRAFARCRSGIMIFSSKRAASGANNARHLRDFALGEPQPGKGV